MKTWILFTMLAVIMQATRTAGQKQIAKSMSIPATTLVRFLFGLPFALAYLLFLTYYNQIDVSHLAQFIESSGLSWPFFQWASLAALAQIFATIFLVKALTIKNFAVGTALAKTEAIMTALIGAWFFSAELHWLGYVSVFLGVIGTLIASKWQMKLNNLWQNTSLKYGLLAGLGFALASLWLKEAILSLSLPKLFGAAMTLMFMVGLQTALCLVWLLKHQPQQLTLIKNNSRAGLFIGFTSVAGSIGWFTAISLQNAALVKTLGQTEFFITLALTYWYFGEKISAREYLGMCFIMISVALLLFSTSI